MKKDIYSLELLSKGIHVRLSGGLYFVLHNFLFFLCIFFVASYTRRKIDHSENQAWAKCDLFAPVGLKTIFCGFIAAFCGSKNY